MTKNTTIKQLTLLAVCLLIGVVARAQVKVGNNPTTINTNSVLEMESTNKGMLLPRLSLSSTSSFAPLAAHVAGMTVYNTATAGDVTPGFYYNDGTKWVRIASPSAALNTTAGSLMTVTNGTGATFTAMTVAVDTNALKTMLNNAGYDNTVDHWQNNGTSTYTTTGSVGIGTNAPTYKLEVRGADSANSIMTVGTTGGTYGTLFLGNSAHGLYRGDYGTTTNINDVSLFTTSGNLNFSSNKVSGPMMTLNNNTHLGIGTESPTNRLHVVNTSNPLRLEGLQSGAASDNILSADASGVVRTRTAAEVVAAGNALTSVSVSAPLTGNGTSGSPLDVTQNNMTAGPLTTVTGGTGATFTASTVGVDTNALKTMLTNAGFDNTTDFWQNSGTTTSILSNKNAQIDGEGYGLTIDASGSKRVGIMKYPGLEMAMVRTKTIKMRFGSVDSMDVTKGTTANFVHEMVIDGANGFVGIGANNTSPTNQLHVLATANPARLEGLQAGANTDNIMMANATGVVRQMTPANFASNFVQEPWYNQATNTGATSNTQNIYQMGNVGIGTTAPVNKLNLHYTSSQDGITNTFNGSLIRSGVSAYNGGAGSIITRFGQNMPNTSFGIQDTNYQGGYISFDSRIGQSAVGIAVANRGPIFSNGEVYGFSMDTNAYVAVGPQLGTGTKATNPLDIRTPSGVNPLRVRGLQASAGEEVLTVDATGVVHKAAIGTEYVGTPLVTVDTALPSASASPNMLTVDTLRLTPGTYLITMCAPIYNAGATCTPTNYYHMQFYDFETYPHSGVNSGFIESTINTPPVNLPAGTGSSMTFIERTFTYTVTATKTYGLKLGYITCGTVRTINTGFHRAHKLTAVRLK